MTIKGLNNQRVRQYNKRVLLSLLYQQKIASKSTLSKLSQLSIPAISNILQEMVEDGVIQHLSENLHSRGLGGGSYQIIPQKEDILCLNISPYRIESQLVDGLINPMSEFEIALINVKTPQELLNEIKKVYKQYQLKYQRQSLRLAISIHGQVNPITGVSQNMPQAAWKTPVEIKYLLEKKLSTSILIDNDCVMLALAEKWLNPNNIMDFCVINVDYGIGCSFLINQQIYRGSLFGSGQIGHTIIDPDGHSCSCGRYGCLETISSLSSLKNRSRQLLKLSTPGEQVLRTPTTQWIIEQYHQGNQEIRSMVIKGARAIGLSLYNFLNILNINRIYLYGRSCGFGQEWLNTIIKQTSFNPFDQVDNAKPQRTQINFGQLTRSEQLMGIAYLYIEQQLSQY